MNREEQIIKSLWALRGSNQSITSEAVKFQVMELVKGTLPESWDVMYQRTIRTLVAAGVLVQGTGGGVTWTEEALKARSESEDKSPSRGGGADGGSPPGGGNGGNDGANGGQGFRAVLAHPYLFALPRGEFEELLDAI